MVFAILIITGLCLGSFVNALVWRLHEQARVKKPKAELSIVNGRSMCPACHHVLSGKDLVPLFSWLALKGKCRYCSKPISKQYPIVELATASLFVASYIWWPYDIIGIQVAVFVLWLLLCVGLMALIVYDVKWFILPNRIIYPLSVLAVAIATLNVINADHTLKTLLKLAIAVIIGGGLFYILFQISGGKWIGGGDVRLGWLLGLVAGTPARSALFIFAASIIGTLVSLPLLASHKLKRTSTIPFGPLLIVGLIITQLFGASIINWYQYHFLNF